MPSNEPSESTPPPRYAGDEPAKRRHRRADDDQTGQTPASQRRLQQQDDRDRGRDQVAIQRAQRSLPLDMLAKHLCMVLERKRALLDADASLRRSRQPGTGR